MKMKMLTKIGRMIFRKHPPPNKWQGRREREKKRLGCCCLACLLFDLEGLEDIDSSDNEPNG